MNSPEVDNNYLNNVTPGGIFGTLSKKFLVSTSEVVPFPETAPLWANWHYFSTTPGTILAPSLEQFAYQKVKNGSRSESGLST